VISAAPRGADPSPAESIRDRTAVMVALRGNLLGKKPGTWRAAVGTRPGRGMRLVQNPASSKSAMTLRIVACSATLQSPSRIAREDTGSPDSMYTRTMSARIWRLRPFLKG